MKGAAERRERTYGKKGVILIFGIREGYSSIIRARLSLTKQRCTMICDRKKGWKGVGGRGEGGVLLLPTKTGREVTDFVEKGVEQQKLLLVGALDKLIPHLKVSCCEVFMPLTLEEVVIAALHSRPLF